MQAARSAAIADGLVSQDKADSVKQEDDDCAPQHNPVGGSTAGVSSSAGYTNNNQTTIHDPNSNTNRVNSIQNPALAYYQATNGGGVFNKQSISAPMASHMNPNLISMNKPTNVSGGGGNGKKKGPALRRGKWTAEEEAYANRLITEFKAGLLPLTDGTTLRTFLSKLLNCDPMRISKKFVGGNCIGKQVFRRRTADINRLTPEQIQQSRNELSELERRFLERVAQTNRVKSSGANSNAVPPGVDTTVPTTVGQKLKIEGGGMPFASVPPWLRPPQGYVHGMGQSMAQAALSNGNNRAAMAGRLLLAGGKNSFDRGLSTNGSAHLLSMMEEQQRQARSMQPQFDNSASNLLAALNSHGSNNKLTDFSPSNSMSSLLMKSGLSRDQLSELAQARSKNSLMDRQTSLDALMSLDFQSLQSIDNLANLIQNGRNFPKNGLKNWTPQDNSSDAVSGSSGNTSNLLNARRLASEGRMENLIRSLSSGNVTNNGQNQGESNANFNALLQNFGSGSNNNLLDHNSAMNLANMLRVDSSTGLSALRMQDGLNHRNNSVDDFLSLVASGDIPHQDPHLLNMPLQSVLQNQSNSSAASILAQHQHLLSQSGRNSNINLSQHLASLNNNTTNVGNGMTNNNSAATLLSGLANSSSVASLLQQYSNNQGSNPTNMTAFSQQQEQKSSGSKRKLDEPDQESVPNKR
jgi:hypothetical protein